MPTSDRGFEQAYNAQTGVDVNTHLIVEQHVTQHTNDKQETAPAIEELMAQPNQLGQVDVLLADTGYHSEANIKRCEAAGIEPLMPSLREAHNISFAKRFADDPIPPKNPSSVKAMAHQLCTGGGKALYARRKSTVETVFGIIKHVLGFR